MTKGFVSRRRVLGGAAAIAATSVVAPHARAAANPGVNTGATIVYYDSSGNETLDPAHPQTASSLSGEVPMALYDTLVRLDPAGALVPGLAQAWRYNADLTVFEMTIRPGVTFHDGTKLTADVVKQNFERGMALGSRASAAVVDALRPVQSIEVEGDNLVRLRLKEPNGQLEYAFSFVTGMMASPAAFADGAFGSTFKPIGSGPFKVDRFDSNVVSRLVRFDQYWDGTATRPAGFAHHYVPDSRARLNALRSGQANISLIEPRQIDEAKQAGLQVQINEKNGAWTIYINQSRPALSDLRVRRAIMHAIDREALAEAFGFGTAHPTTQVFSKLSPVHDPKLDALYPHDLDRATALLKEAGFSKGLEINYLLLNTTEYRAISEAVQSMLAEVGIRVKFDTIDASQFPLFRRSPGRGDIMLGRFGGRADPAQSIFEFAGTGGSVNPVGVAAPEIDTLLNELRRIPPSNPERLAMVRRLNTLVVENVSTFTLMTRANVYAFKPGCIGNLLPFPAGGDDRFNNVTIAAGCT